MQTLQTLRTTKLATPDTLFIGLMSGTSVDAIDAALVRCGPDSIEILATHQHDIPTTIREEVAAISAPGANEIDRMGVLDRQLGLLFADAVNYLLAATDTKHSDVRAVGSHGQTIRHRPPSAGDASAENFTLQIGDPNTITEQTGIPTVADFRRRDIAAGGEGAPLAPAFHAAVLAEPGVNRAIVNIGGIANISVLRGLELVQGFDTGPGNTLLDHWVQRHQDKPYDTDGHWAASGQVSSALLAALLAHPYFEKTGARSTGKEAFNLQWLDTQLKTGQDPKAADVQATLAQLTAASIAGAVAGSAVTIDELYVCGGGAHNKDLMNRLDRELPDVKISSTMAIGMHPDWVEAAAFAWLASQCLERLTGNAPLVTGAKGPRVLGAIYPA